MASRPYRDEYDRDMYDDRPPPRRHSPPPYDRHREPRRDSDRGWSGRDHDDRRSRRSPHRSPRGGRYRDRDREGYRSPSRSWSNSRSRSRSASPPRRRRSRSPHMGGPPSREIMMDGLPKEITEEDISEDLKRRHGIKDLDDVRIIRDRETRTSRGFGFLRFPSVEQAKSFLEKNYPILHLHGRESDGDVAAAKVRVSFSRERDDRGRADVDWTCPNCNFTNFSSRRVCYKCQTPQSAAVQAPPPQQPEFTNSGDSDASTDGSPSQFLLFRGLESGVTEEIFAKGAAKLYKPGAAGQTPSVQGKKGSTKVASTTGDANLGAKDKSLLRVLLVRDRLNEESWRYGFAEFSTIEDAQAALTRFNSLDRFTIASKPVDVCYIHAGVFVPVFQVAPGSEKFSFVAASNPQLRLRYWDDGAYASELVLNEPESARDMPSGRSAADAAAAAAENEGLVAAGDDADGKAKKRKADFRDQSKPKKSAPAHLQFWTSRHAELHGGKAPPPGENAPPDPSEEPSLEPEAGAPPVVSFADPNRPCCLLCFRQFKTVAEVNRHERLSELHRENLGKEEIVAKGRARLKKAGVAADRFVEQGDGSQAAEYRDRAKERRRTFGTAKLPLKKESEAPEAEPAKASKGEALLKQMGWKSGAGLGATGSGMTAPLATELYAQGVGLGAEGGKVGDAAEEADRRTRDSYGDWVERAKEKARGRFEQMQQD